MTLPILLSVPHAGVAVPHEVWRFNLLNREQIAQDGDEGARELYDLADEVAGFLSTDVARAFVDLNRAESDRRRDGIVKTHTCWEVPVYRAPLAEPIVATLLERYYRPYHRTLSQLGWSGRFAIGLDCHTMAATGPPVGPDPGQERPAVCLSNGRGTTCPEEWMESFARCLEETLGHEVRMNSPFTGGLICRSHAREMPWIQVEFSRAPFMSIDDKRACLLSAIEAWCARRGWLTDAASR